MIVCYLFYLQSIIWKRGQQSYENSEKTMYLKDVSCKCKVLINIQGERNHKKDDNKTHTKNQGND
jgi:hypothetical protein